MVSMNIHATLPATVTHLSAGVSLLDVHGGEVTETSDLDEVWRLDEVGLLDGAIWDEPGSVS